MPWERMFVSTKCSQNQLPTGEKSREGTPRRLTWESINSDYRLRKGLLLGEITSSDLGFALQLLDLQNETAVHMLFPGWVGPCKAHDGFKSAL